jgi:crossover junction endodeoxyribonuclease RuvC
MTDQVILGIDPGYDRVGWAVGKAHHGQLNDINFGCIQTKASDNLFVRYQQITQQLEQIIEQYQPTQLAIESLFFFKNQTTAMKVSEARGVIISSCLKSPIQIFEFTPLQIKQAVTGYGRATKEQLDKMVRLQLKLGNQKIIDDAMDALGILLTQAVTFRP